jgi:hypothetical protein
MKVIPRPEYPSAIPTKTNPHADNEALVRKLAADVGPTLNAVERAKIAFDDPDALREVARNRKELDVAIDDMNEVLGTPRKS